MRSYLSGVTSAVAARSMLQRTVDQMVVMVPVKNEKQTTMDKH